MSSPRERYSASPLTLDAELERAAADGARAFVFHLKDGDRQVTPQELVGLAARGAEALRKAGVEPGDTVGVLGPNEPEWVLWAFSAWAAGAAMVPLGFPTRVRDPEALTRHLSGPIGVARCRVVVAEPSLAPHVPPGPTVLPWSSLLPDRPQARIPHGRTVDDPAVIQFTSGSTSSPKGVTLTHRNVMAQAWGLDAFYGSVKERDRFVSWLPLFHDNGLFLHMVTPLALQCENHLIPTLRFAGNPRLWFKTISDVGGTITSGPPSAWAVAMRTTLRKPEDVDVSSLGIGVLTAEMIQPDVVELLWTEGPRIGLRPEVLSAGYGMAEATLAVTITPRRERMKLDAVDPDRLADGEASPSWGGAKKVVSCGLPLPGMEVRVWSGDGPAPDRVVGEIELRGPCRMRGYLGDAEQPFHDGWLRTGDVGYLVDGELHVTGRVKDLVIVSGRNYAPEDIEWVAASVPGVRDGRAVAFSPPGVDNEVTIVLEPSNDADVGALPEQVRVAVMNELGIAVRDVAVLPKGSIPFTTSGKVQRSAVKTMYQERISALTA
jgi:fatty-acyl-CoA synthase